MLEPIPAEGSSNPLEAFYRPAFEIWSANDDLPGARAQGSRQAELLPDIESVSYVDNVEEADSFTLTITNWDTVKRQMKYYGLPRKPDSDDRTGFFEPTDRDSDGHARPKRFLLKLGYQGNLREMMVGFVSNIETTFPQSGAPALRIQTLDVLSKRNQQKFTWRWEQKTDSEIAEELARQPDAARGRPGLGVPVRTRPLASEARHPRVAMRKVSVPSFLLERARLHAYSVFPTVEAGRPAFYFGPSEDLPNGPYELRWGRTLLEFTPTLKASGQPRSVVVRASSRSGPGRVRGKATLANASLNKGLHVYLDAMGKDEEIPDAVMRTNAEAQELAEATLRTSLKGLLEATGSTIGLPDLRAGQAIKIQGVDYRFDGRYFVTQTTHTIDANGYKTTFRARREDKET